MNNLHIKIHELWIEMLMASYMSSEMRSKEKLRDFSNIIFRHFGWVENYLIKKSIEYDYNRNTIPIKVNNLKAIISDIIKRINDISLSLDVCDDETLINRVQSDLDFILFSLRNMNDEMISAFDMSRVLSGVTLSDEATDALTLFLFEESYKEYELIMIYNYLKVHSTHKELIRIFQILIDESFFHLNQFGQMMSDMGVLGVPRTIAKELYQVDDVGEFLKNGIDEEMNAKEECRKLSLAVAEESRALAKFFDFINNQENYHIALMKEALAYYEDSDV